MSNLNKQSSQATVQVIKAVVRPLKTDNKMTQLDLLGIKESNCIRLNDQSNQPVLLATGGRIMKVTHIYSNSNGNIHGVVKLNKKIVSVRKEVTYKTAYRRTMRGVVISEVPESYIWKAVQ